MSRSRSITKSRSRSPAKRRSSPEANDRADTCPFLIRLFVTKGRHVPLLEFDDGHFPVRDEFQVYGWKTSTPSSLIQLLFPSFPPPYRSPLARFSFRHIYVDASQRGLYRSRDLVSFTGRDLMTTMTKVKTVETAAMDMELDDTDPLPRRGGGRKIDEKSLEDYGFITGDLLSVSLYIPEPKIPAGAPRIATAPAGAVPGSIGPGVSSLGWGDRQTRERESERAPDRRGAWQRGEPLPPQDFRGGVAGRASEPAGGGSWRGGGPGMGIRGVGKRSPERNGVRRSRSPEGRIRRESWAKRRAD
ncbi:MAG: hypothetical protein TREMPRED_000367 [Tremellales sp. Tagirdzhanova-0007]|nr:MAG: hypothetical protein TREMPRED_000367 [Tremellales sp. Tagirdzhanova-0007]